MSDQKGNLVKVRGTELLASDTRERYREKLARITLDSMVQFVGLLDANGTVLKSITLRSMRSELISPGSKGGRFGRPFGGNFRGNKYGPQGSDFARLARRICSLGHGNLRTCQRQRTIIIDASLMPVKDDQGCVVFITAEGRDAAEEGAGARDCTPARGTREAR